MAKEVKSVQTDKTHESTQPTFADRLKTIGWILILTGLSNLIMKFYNNNYNNTKR